MLLDVYVLNSNEMELVQILNESRTNILLITCTIGGYDYVVDPISLQQPEFIDYLNLLGGFDPSRVKSVEIE